MKLTQSTGYICLELIPPSYENKSLRATEQLFSVLHGFGERSIFTFEVASTRADGIRYIVKIAKEQASSLIRALAAYLPEVNVREIADYSKANDLSKAKVVEFEQTKHYAYPLKRHGSLEEHDPMSYITGVMTKLSDNELISFQITFSPANPKELSSIRRKILTNENLESHLQKSKSKAASTLLKVANKLSFAVTDMATDMYHGSSKAAYSNSQRDASDKRKVQMGLKPARTVTSFEQDLVGSISDKLAQPLFNATIRVLVLSDNEDEMLRRIEDFKAALSSLSTTGYQSLKAVKKPSKNPNLLSVSEVASIYHFPSYASNKTENIQKSLSRTLPAPVSLKNGSSLDVLLGENAYHGEITPIGLTAAERERHVYIIGGTGNGKTTMLMYGIVQDIKNGKGVAVVDPHGDLAETILQHIPEERVNDVIYFNPADIDHPIGLNLLELPKDVSDSQLALEQDFITEAIVSLFRKTFSEDDSGGHRIEYILRNAVRTAYTVQDATLFTLYDLLTDSKFRNSITQKLTDKRLKQFWHNEFAKAGNMQRVKMTSGVTTKLGRYDSSIVARSVIEQVTSTIDFDDILANGKILICNFAKGNIGEDTAELFGTAVLTKLQLAALRRVRLQQSERRPYYLYVDEFQHFATHSFLQMLSEARKYKLFLTMAEQSTAQQAEQRLVHIILDNVGTVVCFRVRAASEKLLLPIFQPAIKTGEIASLSAYNYYIKIAGMETHEPLSGEAVLLDEPDDTSIAQEVIAASRRQYATKIVASTQKKQQSEVAEEENESESIGFSEEQQPVLHN